MGLKFKCQFKGCKNEARRTIRVRLPDGAYLSLNGAELVDVEANVEVCLHHWGLVSEPESLRGVSSDV